jgi:molybdate transport system substrate-binding protein
MRKFSRRSILRATVLSGAVASISPSRSDEKATIQVYAAASICEALAAALQFYRTIEPVEVRLRQGLSADLAKQIGNDAPADIFVSASEALVAGLAGQKRVLPATITSPVGNNLLLIAPADSPIGALTISPQTDFGSLLGPEGTLATGDPDYVALGVYAMEALVKLGKWKAVEPKLARASSVQAALELVENRKATLGINFSTAAITSNKVKVLGRFPNSVVTPIRYTFAIVRGRDTPQTRKLFEFLTGPDATRIYARYGFAADGP